MKDLFIILETKNKKCTENIYLKSLKKEMNDYQYLIDIFKFDKSFKTFSIGNISNFEQFQRKINRWLSDHGWYNKFEQIFLIYDNDDDNFTFLMNKINPKIKKFLKEDFFKKNKEDLFIISPKNKGHTFDEYLCLHFQNKILDKKESKYFLDKKLNSDKWKSEMDCFLDKSCRINKIKINKKNELFKEVKNNCNNSIYRDLFQE